MNGLNYTVIAEGTVSAGYNPAQPFGLEIFGGAQLGATNSNEVDVWVYHGVTDAPTLDLYELEPNESVQFLDDISYSGNSGNYVTFPATNRSIQVRDQNAIVLGQYGANVIPFAGQALTLLASGFLDPTQNNNGPSFVMLAVGTAGNVISLPSQAVNPSRIQLIHNCASPAAAVVDVWWNVTGTPLVDNFNFRSQTDFLNGPAGRVLRVFVADSSSQDTATVLFQKDFVLESNETYIIIASGTIGGSFNPAIPFDLIPIKGREQSTSPVAVDVQAFHSATDAPAIDLLETSIPIGIIEDSVSYGEVAPCIELPVAEYVIELQATNGGAVIDAYDIDLAPFTGQAITILASGFFDPSVNENGPSFGLWASNGSAGPLIELGVPVSTEETPFTTARLFPNLSTANSTLQLGQALDAPLRWQLVDLLGRIIIEQELPAGQDQVTILLEYLKAGLYFLRLESGGKIQSLPLQKR